MYFFYLFEICSYKKQWKNRHLFCFIMNTNEKYKKCKYYTYLHISLRIYYFRYLRQIEFFSKTCLSCFTIKLKILNLKFIKESLKTYILVLYVVY